MTTSFRGSMVSHFYLRCNTTLPPQIGGVHHRVIKNQPDGTFSIDDLQALMRDNNDPWPRQTLVCVENTHNSLGGKALPVQWMDEVRWMHHGLSLVVSGFCCSIMCFLLFCL